MLRPMFSATRSIKLTLWGILLVAFAGLVVVSMYFIRQGATENTQIMVQEKLMDVQESFVEENTPALPAQSRSSEVNELSLGTVDNSNQTTVKGQVGMIIDTKRVNDDQILISIQTKKRDLAQVLVTNQTNIHIDDMILTKEQLEPNQNVVVIGNITREDPALITAAIVAIQE